MLARFAIIATTVWLGTCSTPPDWLDHVLAGGQLVVVTRETPTTYFLGHDDQPAGPEYDLARRFADTLGVELVIKPRDSLDALFDAVRNNEAHMVAAGIAITDKRKQTVAFSEPYQSVEQQIVYRLGTGRPKSVPEVFERNLVVLRDSSHAETLRAIKADHPRLTWQEIADDGVGDLLSQVADGSVQLTVADSHDFDLHRNFLPEIRVAFDIGSADDLAWVFPLQHSKALRTEANRFFARVRRNGQLARIQDRYYGHTDELDYVGTRTFIRHVDSRLPRYDAWFREAAAAHGLDWRLLAAVGYQESHWRAKAVSPTGVRGIMMLTEATADYLDIDDRTDPRSSIFGAARFIARLKERLPDTIREPDLTWMALAAYNVGFYHLRDARAIVELEGKNPNVWIDVREALPLLAQKKWYQRVKYGYARGWEPVRYVENIRSYASILRWITDERETSDDDAQQLTQPAASSFTDVAP
ncbi:MAG: membrane-bound lytic murein transglycosylase MltF [Pseudomonadota bacterium]